MPEGELEAARRHLRSAARVADDDPDAAYALLYDSARKAVTAHMLAAGLRPRNAPAAHEATALYAAAVLPNLRAVAPVKAVPKMMI